MKISLLTFSYQKKFNSIKSYKNNNNAAFSHTISQDTVSFSGKKNTKIYIKDLRNIENLPCGCCGREMIPNKKLNDFLKKHIDIPADDALEKIKESSKTTKNNISEIEAEMIDSLLNIAKLHPSRTIQEFSQRKEILEFKKNLSEEEIIVFDNIIKKAQKVAHPSSKVIAAIEDFHPSLHRNEQAIFNELKKLSNVYPNLNFNEILNIPEVYNYNLKILLAKENAVLDKISGLAENLPNNEKEIVKQAIQDSKSIFTDEGPEILRKRGRVIETFKNLETNITNEQIFKKIMFEINKLPKSDNSVEAFMVKGAQKDANRIAELILIRTRNTFEHVKPHKRENDPGANSIYNYIGLCGRCNYQRARTPYYEFIENHPEMPQNEQRQIDKIIEEINSGKLYGYDEYPEKIKTALLIESNNKIKIDTTKLNKTLAAENRKKREKIKQNNEDISNS